MSQPLADIRAELGERLLDAKRVLVCVNADALIPSPAEILADEPEGFDMREPLRALADDRRVVLAFVSGRTVDELARLIPFPGTYYVGNHGLEITGPGVEFLEPIAVQFAAPMKEVAAQFGEKLNGIPGASVEDRGLTIVLHCRNVPADRVEEFRNTVHGVLANSSHPFLLLEGAQAYEVRPRAYWNRGHAVAWLREHVEGEPPLIVYIGDHSDEDAFAALTEAITIKLGEAENTAARYTVDSRADVAKFLSWVELQMAPADVEDRAP